MRIEGRLLGIGIAIYGEIDARGSSHTTSTWESATVRVESSRKVTVITGISPHGQGQETTFAQIVADELGVDAEDVVFVHGDTAVVPYGMGTFASRATAVGGSALYYALQDLKAKIKKFGGLLLNSDDVAFCGGRCICNKTGEAVDLSNVVDAYYRASQLPPNTEPGIEATCLWEQPNFAFPFGAQIVISEVDRETGQVEIRRYVVVNDCGKMINPLLVDGQVHGGVVQGLGQAVFEQAVYDEYGQLMTGELVNYAIPRATMVPLIEVAHTETPACSNPLGVRGVGEAATIGCSPAIVNSVVDALSDLGVRHIDMPLTPEKLWKLIRSAGKRRQSAKC